MPMAYVFIDSLSGLSVGFPLNFLQKAYQTTSDSWQNQQVV